MSTIKKVLLIIAVSLFVLTACGVTIGSLSLVPAGLALFASSFLFDK